MNRPTDPARAAGEAAEQFVRHALLAGWHARLACRALLPPGLRHRPAQMAQRLARWLDPLGQPPAGESPVAGATRIDIDEAPCE